MDLIPILGPNLVNIIDSYAAWTDVHRVSLNTNPFTGEQDTIRLEWKNSSRTTPCWLIPITARNPVTHLQWVKSLGCVFWCVEYKQGKAALFTYNPELDMQSMIHVGSHIDYIKDGPKALMIRFFKGPKKSKFYRRWTLTENSTLLNGRGRRILKESDVFVMDSTGMLVGPE